MGVFIGLDVSLSKTAVCVVDGDGAVLWQGKAPSEPGPLIARLPEWSGSIDLAGIEACPLSEWLHRGLREAGIPVICIEVRHAQRFLSSRPVKTDRNERVRRLVRKIRGSSLKATEPVITLRGITKADGAPAPDKAKMDALENLRAEIRALGASGREGQRGVYGTRRVPVEVDLGSALPTQLLM